jgi:DNA-binding NarL/FixJ family response regulator
LGVVQRESRIIVVLGQFGSIVSRGICQILDDDGGFCLAAIDLDAAALEQALVRQAPNVAILDEASVLGPSLLLRLRAARPGIGLLVFAHRPTRSCGLRLLGFGATVCLSKDASGPEVLSAIRLAADGKHVFASTSDGSASVTRAGGLISLTLCERGVLELLSRGRSNAQIALALHVSIETVRTHAKHVYRKLGVSARGELLGIELPEQVSIEDTTMPSTAR